MPVHHQLMQKRRGRVWGLSLAAKLLLICTWAGGCAESGAATLGTAVIALDEFDASVRSMANAISFAVDGSANNISTQLLNSSAVLREHIQSTVRDADDRITRQQEELLDRLLELRDAADSSAAAATGSVEHIVSEVGQLISDLPGTSNEPRVYRVSATPYVPNWTETVTLVLRGVNLDRPDNYLEIGGTRLEPTSTSATAAEFTIPADRIAEYFDSSATGVQQQRGTITLHYRSGLFRRERSKQQFVALTAVPRNLGAASVVFTSTTSLANTQRFTSYVCAKGTRGPGWRGGAREESQSCQINAPVNPVGCKGQPQTGTIVGNPVLRTIANRHGGGAQITSLGQHSFTIAVTARSSSRPGGGGGLYAAEASYDVAFPCAVPREERSTPMQIRIGVDTTFTLPRDRESRFVNLELTMVDSSRHVLRGARAANRFISIEHASGTVIIRPIRVERN